MRMRKKPNLAPRMEKCSHLLISQPEQMYGHWLQTFSFDAMQLELGCGKGRFITETAGENPGTLFIAVEKTANVLVTALERAVREELQNVRFINAGAEHLAQYFAPGEVSRIYINFCDPWPSNKHRKRRLTGRGFLLLYNNILSDKGEIHFKTDNLPLFEFSLHEFESCGFSVIESIRDFHKNGHDGIMTEYEQRFCELGLPIYFCRITKDKAVETNGSF